MTTNSAHSPRENTVNQRPRFIAGQKVHVLLPPYEYLKPLATVTDVAKGETDWRYYVRYNGRGPGSGYPYAVCFAEELTPA